jgi:hypothetical protein
MALKVEHTQATILIPRLLWNGCLRDNATTVRATITLISRDGVDGSGTRGLGLRSVKGDEGRYREEIH